MAKTPGTPHSSNKAGLKSLGKKMENSRHGFETPPAAQKPAGAFGAEPAEDEYTAARRRQEGTATRRPGKASALRRVK